MKDSKGVRESSASFLQQQQQQQQQQQPKHNQYVSPNQRPRVYWTK